LDHHLPPRGRRRIFVRELLSGHWRWLLIDIENGNWVASGQAESEADALAQAERAARRLRGLRD
jgi:hypothetical protein